MNETLKESLQIRDRVVILQSHSRAIIQVLNKLRNVNIISLNTKLAASRKIVDQNYDFGGLSGSAGRAWDS